MSITNWGALAREDGDSTNRVWPQPTPDNLIEHLNVSHGGIEDAPEGYTIEDLMAWHQMVHADDAGLMHSHEREALDVWLRIPDGEDEAEAEANTFEHDGGGFVVEWYLTSVGQVTKRRCSTHDEAKTWLTAEGFEDYSS